MACEMSPCLFPFAMGRDASRVSHVASALRPFANPEIASHSALLSPSKRRAHPEPHYFAYAAQTSFSRHASLNLPDHAAMQTGVAE